MKTLIVPTIYPDDLRQSSLPEHSINQTPWTKEGDLSCKAAFSISHFNYGMCIKYSVVEPFLHVKKRKINGAVHKDNCVEFFIAFDEDKSYYNFEFNCLGSIKAAFGENRQKRKFLSPDILMPIVDSIEISLDNNGAGNLIRWTLTVILPMGVFFNHKQHLLSGITCKANFTKCGDGLPNPHFLSWTDIPTATPDFHQPSYFGKLIFEHNDL